MLRAILTTAVLAVLATPGFAQDLTFGQVDLDYTNISADGGELDSTALNGDVEFEVNQFLLGASFNNQSLDSGMGSSLTFLGYEAFGAYMLTAETLVGAGLIGVDFDGDDINGFEVFGQYRTDQFGVAINFSRLDDDGAEFDFTTLYGQAEVTPGVTLGAVVESVSETDGTVYVLSAEYDAGPIFARTYYDGFTDVDGGIFGVRGSYDFTDVISASASYQTSVDDFFGDFTAYTVGAGYEFTEGLYGDFAVGRIDLGGGDEADLLQIGLSFELGDRRRLDNQIDNAMRIDNEKGIGAFIPNVGFGIGLAF